MLLFNLAQGLRNLFSNSLKSEKMKKKKGFLSLRQGGVFFLDF